MKSRMAQLFCLWQNANIHLEVTGRGEVFTPVKYEIGSTLLELNLFGSVVKLFQYMPVSHNIKMCPKTMVMLW